MPKKISFGLVLFGCLMLVSMSINSATTGYQQKSIEIGLFFDGQGQRITNLTIKLIPLSPEEYRFDGDYSVDFLYENQSLFKRVYFDLIQGGMHYSSRNGGGMIPEDISGAGITLDYYSDIRYLVIKHNESNLRTIDLNNYFCNRNSICEPPQETHLSCPDDCSAYARDGYCSGVSGDGKCDPDCGNKFDNDCPLDETTNATVITKTMADFNRTEYEAWFEQNQEPDLYRLRSVFKARLPSSDQLLLFTCGWSSDFTWSWGVGYSKMAKEDYSVVSRNRFQAAPEGTTTALIANHLNIRTFLACY